MQEDILFIMNIHPEKQKQQYIGKIKIMKKLILIFLIGIISVGCIDSTESGSADIQFTRFQDAQIKPQPEYTQYGMKYVYLIGAGNFQSEGGVSFYSDGHIEFVDVNGRTIIWMGEVLLTDKSFENTK